MSYIVAFAIIVSALAVGDLCAAKSKGLLPSVFIASLIMLFGYWTFMPEDIGDIARITNIFPLLVYLLITHMGTLISLRELAEQWKTVLVALAGVCGIVLVLMFIGAPLVGRDYAIAGAPPLTGGVIATAIMQEKAAELNLPALGLVALLVYVLQKFVGIPLTACLLRIECLKLRQTIVNDNYQQKQSTDAAKEPTNTRGGKRETLLPPVADKYNSPALILARLAIVAAVAMFLAGLTGNVIHPVILCLIFGMLSTKLGFTDRDSLQKAKSSGFLLTLLIANILFGLNKATPKLVLDLLGPAVAIISIGTVGCLLFSLIIGKIVKTPPFLAMCLGLTALFGFPVTYVLSHEVCKGAAENEEEFEKILGFVLPKMLVAGFTTVTVASAVIAGIMADWF